MVSHARIWLALLTLLATTLPACTTPQTPEDRPATKTPASPDPAGNDRWRGGALELPSRSPVVATIRIDEVLRNARGLRRWLIAEPQMFGPDGQTFTQRFRQGWNQLAKGLGNDPLSEEGPTSAGIDVERPVYLGLYPADAVDGRTFVERLEKALRSQLDLADTTSLGEALSEMQHDERTIPAGFHKKVTDTLDGLRPRAGFRLVVPLSDANTFVEQFTAAASFAEYDQLTVPKLREEYGSRADSEPTGPYPSTNRVRGFVNLDNRWPVVTIRTDGRWAKIDGLFQEFHLRTASRDDKQQRRRLRRDIRKMIGRFETGRPLAPAPFDAPFASVNADQKTTSEFARMQAYKEVLETVSKAGVDKRNRVLVGGLTRAVALGEQWSAAADKLSGVSYGVHGATTDDRPDNHYARLAMTLFGSAPSQDLSLEAGGRNLGVEDRAAGVSMDLDPLFSKAWNDWLGLDDLTDLVGSSKIATDYPTMYLLSIPRNLALFLVNAESLVENVIPEPLRPLFDGRRDLQRLELATSGADLRSLRTDPNLVGLLTFDRQAAGENVDLLLEALPTLMTLGFSMTDTPDGVDSETLDEAQKSFKRNQLASFPLPQTHPASPFRYYARSRDDQGSFLFFTRGLTKPTARHELDRLRPDGQTTDDPTSDETPRALFARIEPAALTTLLTSYDPDALSPLQPGILAQRLGAFELSVHPQRRDDVQMLHYQFDLRKPPEL